MNELTFQALQTVIRGMTCFPPSSASKISNIPVQSSFESVNGFAQDSDESLLDM
jgi:hypothetical protein